MSEPAVHDVVVYRLGESIRVTPGTLVARTTDFIAFWLVGVTEATLLLPTELAAGEVRGFRLVAGVDPETERPMRPVPIPIDGLGLGCWEYGVYVGGDHRFAEGGSQPKIIVLE